MVALQPSSILYNIYYNNTFLLLQVSVMPGLYL